MPTPRRLAIALGTADDGTPAVLSANGENLLVSGDRRSGKSWVAGLAAECLLEAGYRVCLFDAESDHLAVGHRPGAMSPRQGRSVPGGRRRRDGARRRRPEHRPRAHVAATAEQARVRRPRLRSVAAERGRSGLPHWIVVDEAHYFFGAGGSVLCRRSRPDGQHRASDVSREPHRTGPARLHRRVHPDADDRGAGVVLRRRAAPRPWSCRARRVGGAPRAGVPARGALVARRRRTRWQTFVPGPRLSAHTVRTRRDATVELSPEKGFFFRLPDDGSVVAARTVEEFDQALASVRTASLEHHVARGDFSRWARDVLGDADLAAGLAKLETTSATGAPVDREELRRHLHARYVL